MTVSDFSTVPETPTAHSTYSIYKRLANLVLAVIGVVLCINLWLLSTDQAQNWYDKQANQLGRSLSVYAAKTLSQSMTNENETEELRKQRLLDLVADPHVISASLYDKKGVMLDTTRSQVSLLTSFKLQSQAPLVFVEPVRVDGNVAGYLRLLLATEQVMAYHADYQRQMFEQMLVLGLLAAAAGLLATRGFYKFKYRHYSKPVKPQKDA